MSRGQTTITVSAGGKSASFDLQVRGTLHAGIVLGQETWTVAQGPHVVEGLLNIDGLDTAVLTLVPGDSVFFKAGAGLDFQSGRLAMTSGTDSVLLTGDRTRKGFWMGIIFNGPHASELRHVRMEYCGGVSPGGPVPGCVSVAGDALSGTGPDLLVDGLNITNSGSDGLTLDHHTTLNPASAYLTVSQSAGRPIVLAAELEPMLPPGLQIIGNAEEGVWVETGTVADTTTWIDPGVPLHLDGTVGVQGAHQPVLTIPAGTHVMAETESQIVVGDNGQGGLVVGASGGPAVTFVSAGTGWGGILFEDGARSGALFHVTMDGCGVFAPCLLVRGAGTPVLVQDLTITGSHSIGVQVQSLGRLDPASSNLSITGSADVPLEIPSTQVPTIPTGVYHPNTVDGIRLTGGGVNSSAKWSNLGAPYLLPAGLAIGSPDSIAILTLDSGVTLIVGATQIVAVASGGAGALRAVGTATAPVVFASATPGAAGSWVGVDLSAAADTNTHLDHVEIRDAGQGYPGTDGALRLHLDPGGVLLNSTILRSATCGIVLYSGNVFKQDYTAPASGNSFVQIADSLTCRP